MIIYNLIMVNYSPLACWWELTAGFCDLWVGHLALKRFIWLLLLVVFKIIDIFSNVSTSIFFVDYVNFVRSLELYALSALSEAFFKFGSMPRMWFLAALHAYLIRYLLCPFLLSCEEPGVTWLRLRTVPIPTVVKSAVLSYIAFQYLSTCRKSIESWSFLIQVTWWRRPLLGKPTATWQFSCFERILGRSTIDFEELVVLLPHEFNLILPKIDHIGIPDINLYSRWQWAVLLRCLRLPLLSTSIGQIESWWSSLVKGHCLELLASDTARWALISC